MTKKVEKSKSFLKKNSEYTPYASSSNGNFAFGDQGASPLEPDRQGAGAEYFRSGKGVSPFPPGGRLYCGQAGEYLSGTPLRSATASAFLPGMTSTAKPHGGMEGGAPEKYPQLLGFAEKSQGPWPKGGNFLGKRALPAPAAAGGHARNGQMLTI